MVPDDRARIAKALESRVPRDEDGTLGRARDDLERINYYYDRLLGH
jgi:hypothetical protein